MGGAWPDVELRSGRRSELRTGLLFGLLAGGTLVVVVWGMDAWSLSRSGGMLAWMKTAYAAAWVVLPLGVLGWATVRLRSSAATTVLWVLAGAAFGWFAAEVAFRFFSWALVHWVPETAPFIAYDFGEGPSTRGALASMVGALAFLAAGTVSSSLQESASRSAYPAGRVLAVLAWIGIFAVSGAMVDSLINRPLRMPVTALDTLISFRLSSPDAMSLEAKRRHASVLNPVEDLLPLRHRIAVAGYDTTLELVRVLVGFEGEWVECTLITGQPVFCERLEEFEQDGAIPAG